MKNKRFIYFLINPSLSLEKKLKTKSIFNSEIEKKEIPDFINALRFNPKEIGTLCQSPFYGLRKILDNSVKIHNFEVKESIQPFVSQKLIQYIHDNFTTQLETYSDFCMEQYNLKSLYSLLCYKEILPTSLVSEISTFYSTLLESGNAFLRGNLMSPTLEESSISSPLFYKSLSLIDNPKFDAHIIEYIDLIQIQFEIENHPPFLLKLIDSLNEYKTENILIQEARERFNNNIEKIREEDKVIARNNDTIRALRNNNASNTQTNNNDSEFSWVSILKIGFFIIVLLRFCSR